MQIETCKLERSLLYTAVNRSSWGEYLRSLKEVYMRARACCKRIQAIKPFIAVSYQTCDLYHTDLAVGLHPRSPTQKLGKSALKRN